MGESVDTSATVGDRHGTAAVPDDARDAQNDVVLDDVVLDDVVLDVDRVRQWAYRCVDGLTDRCDEINELNVFPIADSDTGTNLMFTVRAAVESMRGAGPEADLATVTAALAHGAVSGARGNSGVIASQLMRALAEAAADRTALSGTDVRGALHRAAQLAADVVSVPVEGTIVTVLESSAAAVAALEPNEGVVGVVRRAVEAAAEALTRTRAQLPVLDAAGVVDAGGLGLLVMLDALAEAVTGERADRPRFHRSSVTLHRTTRAAPGHGHVDAVGAGDPVGFEVVYRVTRIGDDDVVALRRALSQLGDSVVVAGDGVGTWTAHVHTANAGVAVEAGLGFGRVHDIRIEALVASEPCAASTPADRRNSVSGRDILAVVAGAGAQKLYADEGATVLRCDTSRIGTSELCAAIVGSEHTEVLVLPNGALSAQELVSVSIASRTAGKDVLMLPSSAMVQGLAALAVHDATRAAVDDAFAMSEAAAGTRWASLRIAEERSLTWAGTCEPGDGLGLVGPEVVVIGPDVVAAGRDLLDQLLSVGGEMVTMLCGACEASLGDEKSVAERLTAYVATRHPGVEVVVYQGGQPGDVLQLGVE